MARTPSLLFIRPGISFWVEHESLVDITATTDAIKDGVFDGAWIVDEFGAVRKIVATSAEKTKTLTPWRKVPVGLTLGDPEEFALEQLKRWMLDALDGENAFAEHLADKVASLRTTIANANTPAELIAAAAKIAG